MVFLRELASYLGFHGECSYDLRDFGTFAWFRRYGFSWDVVRGMKTSDWMGESGFLVRWNFHRKLAIPNVRVRGGKYAGMGVKGRQFELLKNSLEYLKGYLGKRWRMLTGWRNGRIGRR